MVWTTRSENLRDFKTSASAAMPLNAAEVKWGAIGDLGKEVRLEMEAAMEHLPEDGLELRTRPCGVNPG